MPAPHARISAPVVALVALAFLAAVPDWAAAPQAPSAPAYGVEVVEDWIPMADGVRLAVGLFMPTGGKPGEKFAAVLEYLPYRKDDGTAARDYPIHSYFVRRGKQLNRTNLAEHADGRGTSNLGESVCLALIRVR